MLPMAAPCRIIWIFFCLVPLCLTGVNIGQAREASSLESRLEEFINDKKAQIGIAVIFDNGSRIVINNDIKFPLLSVFKFHQALAVASKLAQSKLPLTATLHIDKIDLLPDTYSPLRDEHPEGDVDLNFLSLFSYTLQKSDNNVCDLLFNKFMSPADTDKYIRSLGISDFEISQTEAMMHEDVENSYKNWTSPLAAAELVDKFLHEHILPDAYQVSIKEILLGCETGQNRLKAAVSRPGESLGHKTGTGDRNRNGQITGVNDIGFVEFSNGAYYIIAVFIKDSTYSYEETEGLIGEIAKMVNQYYNKTEM